MNAMVTGGTGFIGAALVRLLLERDAENVVAFHRNPAKKTLNDLADRITLVHGDLGIYSHVLEVVKTHRPHIIYHLGAMLTIPSDSDPPAAFQSNVMGIFHILEAARLFDVKQVLFASSIGAYGGDVQSDVIDDYTVERPNTMYGVSKAFGENLGRYYKLKYGVDFRGLRYPGIVGPGFRTPSLAQYASMIIEESAMGRPFTLQMEPDVKFPFLYVKDAALAMIKLSQAAESDIMMVNYILNGVEPLQTAQELVDIVNSKLPKAQLTFEPDQGLTQIYHSIPKFDDRCAREEWGWQPEYDHERMIDDFIADLNQHPERYT